MGNAAKRNEFDSEQHRDRVMAFRGATLALLELKPMTASEVGRVLYGVGMVATGRARGGLLALRSDGMVDSAVDKPRAMWRVTREGRAWLTEALTIREDGIRE